MIIRTALTLGACLTLASLSVSAQTVVDETVDTDGDGYINVGGTVLKSGLGECFQTGTLGDDNLINKCAGIADEEEDTDVAGAGDDATGDDAAAEEIQQAAAPEAAPEAPAAPEQTARIDTREFSEQALFDTNSASLNAEGNAVMSSLFSALADYKGITAISVTGHTDSRGSESYNQALSEQRAATVAALISQQYPDASMAVSGAGESQPAASNFTPEGRQQNRRVDIDITATRMTFN